jgi:hypothetical protein
VINFRYHVVSLTAVFLALAIGLVVGTAALNGPVADTLKDQVNALGKDNSNLRAHANQLEEEVNRQEDFAVQVAPALIGGKLAGRRVLLVVLPGGEDYADGVVKMLGVAGATITARITVQDKFLAPDNDVELLDLADRASQTAVPTDGLPRNSVGVETSSALLAVALQQSTPAITANNLRSVLTAYSQANYLAVENGAVGGAEATVVVSGLPPTDNEAARRSQAAVTLTNQFAGARPLVVAGNGVGEGNLVSEVRGDPTMLKISPVDNVGTAQGQLVTALVTEQLLVKGRAGQYGLAPGATSLLPSTAP